MLRWLLLILCMSSVSQAALYINGVRVDPGLTNIKLRNVDVDIDAQGDVHITAKGYQINVAEPAQPPRPQPPPPTAGRNAAQPTKYFLTMAQNGDPQWD